MKLEWTWMSKEKLTHTCFGLAGLTRECDIQALYTKHTHRSYLHGQVWVAYIFILPWRYIMGTNFIITGTQKQWNSSPDWQNCTQIT